MGIEHDVMARFEDALDSKIEKKARASGTAVMAEVVEVDGDGTPWVRVFGAESALPATTRTASAGKGDLVTLTIRSGKAMLNGNLTSPSASQRDYQELKQITVREIANIKEALIDRAVIQQLIAGAASIQDLYADFAHVTDGVIDNAKISYADVDGLSANYAQIDAANIGDATARNAWVDQLMVQTGLIAHEGAVYTLDAIQLNADRITAGTIDVERLIVTVEGEKYLVHVDASGPAPVTSYQKLDGGVIEDLTITADKLVAGAVTAEKITADDIAGAGGWINLRNGTFGYVNAETGEGISWDGANLTINASSITTQISSALSELGVGDLPTMVRAYGGGVLVCRTGQPVGALMDAGGSFDVVEVAWEGGEPVAGARVASYGPEGAFVGREDGAHVAIDGSSIRLGYADLTPFEVAAVLEREVVSEEERTFDWSGGVPDGSPGTTALVQLVDSGHAVTAAWGARVVRRSTLATSGGNPPSTGSGILRVVTDEVMDADFDLPDGISVRRARVRYVDDDGEEREAAAYVADLTRTAEVEALYAAELAANGPLSQIEVQALAFTYRYAELSVEAPSAGDSLAIRLGGRGTVPTYKYASLPPASSLPALPCLVVVDGGGAYLGYDDGGIPALAPLKGSVTGVKGNAEADYRTGQVSLTPADVGAAPADHAHRSLEAFGSVSGSTHAVALKAYFDANKAGTPRQKLVDFYSSAYNNGSLAMGYFLSGYDANPYGGFFVAHYNNPRYVGIQSGTYTEWTLSKEGHTHPYLPLTGGTLTGLLGITANGNTVTIGSANTGWTHFNNSVSRPFYFSHAVHVNGDIYKYNGPRVQYVPTVLYNNTTGTNGTVTLSASAASYNHMRIYYRTNDSSAKGSVDLYSPNGSYTMLSFDMPRATNRVTIKAQWRLVSGTSITVPTISGWGVGGVEAYLYSGGQLDVSAASTIYITRVEAWNE